MPHAPFQQQQQQQQCYEGTCMPPTPFQQQQYPGSTAMVSMPLHQQVQQQYFQSKTMPSYVPFQQQTSHSVQHQQEFGWDNQQNSWFTNNTEQVPYQQNQQQHMNNLADNWSKHGLNQPPTQQRDRTALSVPGTFSHGKMGPSSNIPLPHAPVATFRCLMPQ